MTVSCCACDVRITILYIWPYKISHSSVYLLFSGKVKQMIISKTHNKLSNVKNGSNTVWVGTAARVFIIKILECWQRALCYDLLSALITILAKGGWGVLKKYFLPLPVSDTTSNLKRCDDAVAIRLMEPNKFSKTKKKRKNSKPNLTNG